MNNTKLVSLDTGKTVATIDVVCLTDILKGFDSKGYHLLEVTPTSLDEVRRATSTPEVFDALAEALGSKTSFLLGYAEAKPAASWKLTGVVMDRSHRPLPGLRVLAYDKDSATKDDFLGCAFTDEKGSFEIGYEEASFKGRASIIDFEGSPDLYLEVTEVSSNTTKRTVVRDEAGRNEYFEIKLSFDSKCSVLRPIVGRYFIEEDLFEVEIAELKSLATQEPGNPEHQFYLGLCLIESIKIDLRQSEWILGEVRSDDDTKALQAIECFENVLELDPERAEVALHYRTYAEELRNLAL